MTFANPLYFLLLLIIIPLILWKFAFKEKHEPALKVATTMAFANFSGTWKTKFVHLPFFVRLITLILLIIALARPQTNRNLLKENVKGIDIMLAIDISQSMRDSDIPPSRIQVAKKVATEFIENRPNDKIGLTLFGGEAFLQCPLTLNHAILLNTFKQLNCELQQNSVLNEGTAIGMGIATAALHLKKYNEQSKIVILLTDGSNNSGEISPFTAAEMAKKMHIRVYTILIGTQDRTSLNTLTLPNGEAYNVNMQCDSDPSTLKQIAKITGGMFYSARDINSLRKIYSDIGKLEKSKLEKQNQNLRYDIYQIFVIAAIISFLLEILLRLFIFKRIP